MFSKTYKIKSSECDVNLKLKISSLFQMFQDLSVDATEKIGYGKSKTLDRGYLWVLEKVSLDIIKYPEYLDVVIFETYALKMIHFIYPRYYVLKDKNGNTLLTMKALWILMDQKKRKVALQDETKIIIEEESDEEVLSLLSPTRISDELSLISKRKVQYSDVDINNHLSNKRYIEYMIDLNDSSFYRHHEITHLTLEYKKELKEQDEIVLYSSSNKEEIVGKHNEEIVYLANIKYRSY